MLGAFYSLLGRSGTFTPPSGVDPASLNLKLYAKAGDYEDATPTWPGTASAGTSGSYTIQDDGGTFPAVATVGGYDVADFDGTTDYLGKTGQLLNGLVSSSAGTIVVVFRADSAVATAGAAYSADALITDIAPYFAIGYDASGVRAATYDGGGWREPTAVAAATGADHVAVVTWDGTDVKLSVDGGAWSTTSSAGVSVIGYEYTIGVNYLGTGYFEGKIYEILAGAFSISDANKDGLYAHYTAEPWWGL